MAPSLELLPSDCGLCAAILTARIAKASNPEQPLTVDKGPKRLTRIPRSTWDLNEYKKLRISFWNGEAANQAVKDRIIFYAKHWLEPIDSAHEPCLELSPQEKYSRQHEIRIRLLPTVTKATRPGERDVEWVSQSFLGNTGLHNVMSEKCEASMDLAILDLDDKEDAQGVNMFRRRVLHEFGQALSFDHEQDHDDFNHLVEGNHHSNSGATDDKPADGKTQLAQRTAQPQASDVTSVQKIAGLYVDGRLAGSRTADRKSVMMYPFENKGELIDGTTISWNTKLSDEDRRFALLIYPPKVKHNK